MRFKETGRRCSHTKGSRSRIRSTWSWCKRNTLRKQSVSSGSTIVWKANQSNKRKNGRNETLKNWCLLVTKSLNSCSSGRWADMTLSWRSKSESFCPLSSKRNLTILLSRLYSLHGKLSTENFPVTRLRSLRRLLYWHRQPERLRTWVLTILNSVQKFSMRMINFRSCHMLTLQNCSFSTCSRSQPRPNVGAWLSKRSNW